MSENGDKRLDGELRFTENMGQLIDDKGKAAPYLLFSVKGAGSKLYITQWGLSYVFTKETYEPISTKISPRYQARQLQEIAYCRADVELVGAQILTRNITAENPLSETNDYYLGHCPDGILDVRSYQKILIKEVYPGIDWVFYTTGTGNMKYDFIVRPGADPSAIKLRYKWTDAPQLTSQGELLIKTPLGQIVEGKPVAYYQESKERISVSYSVEENFMAFNLGIKKSDQTLVIDPALLWGTYAGGSAADIGEDVYSNDSSIWMAGRTMSLDFPTQNSGSGTYFQGSYAGGSYEDLVILRFAASGALLHATYYGGTDRESVSAIAGDSSGIYITGITSSGNLPLFNAGGGAYYQPSATNTYILKFDLNGVRKWATYYGYPTNSPEPYSIHSDGKNLWLAGTGGWGVYSLNPGGGAYFQSSPGSYMDAFIAKFTINGIAKWGTTYGGSDNDYAWSIHSDGKNVWVTGLTESGDFPLFNGAPGSYNQPFRQGNADAYILKFDTAGVRKWCTYYGGSLEDAGLSIFSTGKYVCIGGSTASPNLVLQNPGQGAYFQAVYGGGNYNFNGDIFVLKCDTAGSIQWGTYYGGTSDEWPRNIFATDHSIWVSGLTQSSNFPVLSSPGGYNQSNFAGGFSDNFILQFAASGKRQWASYHGGALHDDPFGMFVDSRYLWLTGGTWSINLPVYNPGSGAFYQGSLNSSNAGDAFLLKFCAVPFVDIPNSTLCAGQPVTLAATAVPPSGTFSWSPVASATNSLTVSPTTTTIYSVTLIDSATGCISTSTATVTVNPKPVASINNAVICAGQSATLNSMVSIAGGSYYWLPGAYTTPSISVNPNTSSIYTLYYTDTLGCADTAMAFVTFNASVPPAVSLADDTVCAGSATTLSPQVSPPGGTFLWMPGAQTTSTIAVTPFSLANYTVNYTDTATGCSATAANTIYTLPQPTVTAAANSPVCMGDTLFLSAIGGSGHVWTGPAGFNSGQQNPLHLNIQYNEAGLYIVSVSDTNNCVNTDTVQVSVINCSTALQANFGQIHVYPIPSQNTVHLTFEHSLEKAQILLYDARGARIDVSWIIQGKEIVIDITHLAPGAYYAIVNLDDRYIFKLVKS